MSALVRLRPWYNRLACRLRGDSGGEAPCEETVLHPAEDRPVPRVVIDPRQLDRIASTYAGSTLDHQLRLFRQPTVREIAVTRKIYRDVFVHRHGFAIPGWTVNDTRLFDAASVLRDPIETLPRASYCMLPFCHTYFGHWLRDTTTSALLAEPGTPRILHCPPGWSHARDYRDLFGLDGAEGPLFHVGELVVHWDFGQTASKAARYRELHGRLRRNLPERRGRARRVWLERGGGGQARTLSDSPGLDAWLARNGFEVVSTDGLPVAGIAAEMLDAEIVITVEGSHVNHAHFMMRPGGLLVILNPCDRFNSTHAYVADAFGNRVGMVVLEGSLETGYRLEPGELDHVISISEGFPGR